MTVTRSKTASQRLADHIVDLRFEDLPADVVAQVKMLLIHHLGVAFRGDAADEGRRAVDVAMELSEDVGSSTVIGNTRRATLLDAVFANAFLMSHDGLDDFLMPGGLHPGTVVQPAAWAVGERVGASGRELIVAVVVGYDAMCKLGNSTWAWGATLPRRSNAVFAPFGAAATAARLQSLPHETVADALGQAAHCGMGIIEGGEYPWVIHPLLARNGVLAAQLAKGGFPTAPTMIEGEHGLFMSFFGYVPDQLDVRLAMLGEEFDVCAASTKRYRGSGLNIVPTELMVGLVNHHGLDADRTARVDITLPLGRKEREDVWETALARDDTAPNSRLGSLRFRTAAIVVDGRLDGRRFDAPMDARIRQTIDKVQLHFEPRDEVKYTRIEVTTTEGKTYVAEGDGHALPPVDPLEWLGQGGEVLFGEERLQQLADSIAHLEDVDNVADVTSLFVP